MDKHIDELIDIFHKIKSLGWIRTQRHGDQMLGNTLEDLLNISENNSKAADWKGIELKTHRNITSSPISLFTKSPSHPKRANSYLREKYGVSDNHHGLPKLNTRIKGDSFNTHRSGFGFKLNIDKAENKIFLLVKNLENNEIVDRSIYWNFDVIEDALNNKIKKIAVFYGDSKSINNENFVKFDKIVIIKNLTIDKMISALDRGDLYLELRLGVYDSGANFGKLHDHGSGFRINLNKLIDLGEELE